MTNLNLRNQLQKSLGDFIDDLAEEVLFDIEEIFEDLDKALPTDDKVALSLQALEDIRKIVYGKPRVKYVEEQEL